MRNTIRAERLVRDTYALEGTVDRHIIDECFAELVFGTGENDIDRIKGRLFDW